MGFIGLRIEKNSAARKPYLGTWPRLFYILGLWLRRDVFANPISNNLA